MTKKIVPTVKEQVDDFEARRDEVLMDLYKRSTKLSSNILGKAEKLSQEQEFNKDTDPHVLKVFDTVLKRLQKERELSLRERLVKKEEISMFHQLLQDANTGNLSDDDIKALEYEARNNHPRGSEGIETSESS